MSVFDGEAARPTLLIRGLLGLASRSSAGGRAVEQHTEVFVGIDVVKLRNAIAVADGERGGDPTPKRHLLRVRARLRGASTGALPPSRSLANSFVIVSSCSSARSACPPMSSMTTAKFSFPNAFVPRSPRTSVKSPRSTNNSGTQRIGAQRGDETEQSSDEHRTTSRLTIEDGHTVSRSLRRTGGRSRAGSDPPVFSQGRRP